MTLLYCFVRTTLLTVFKIFFRLKVINSEYVPVKGGVIVVTNHASHLDPMAIGCAIKKRQPTFMARHNLFEIPVIGYFVNKFSFPVDRDNPKPSTIKEAVRRIKNGELIVMYPEGERSKDGMLRDAKRGVGMIALMSKAVVVPAYIDGTDRALPRGAKFIRRVKIKVVFGRPIEIKGEEAGRNSQEKAANDIMEAIRSLKVKAEAETWK